MPFETAAVFEAAVFGTAAMVLKLALEAVEPADFEVPTEFDVFGGDLLCDAPLVGRLFCV